MRNISLRKFKVEIVDITDTVEVSRRDPEGNIQLLGVWTPYAKAIVAVHPSTMSAEALDAGALSEEIHPRLEIPVDDRMEHRVDSGPRYIRTPEEAAAVVAPHPVRAVPKPSQRSRRR